MLSPFFGPWAAVFGRDRQFMPGCLAHYLADGLLMRWVFPFIHSKGGLVGGRGGETARRRTRHRPACRPTRGAGPGRVPVGGRPRSGVLSRMAKMPMTSLRWSWSTRSTHTSSPWRRSSPVSSSFFVAARSRCRAMAWTVRPATGTAAVGPVGRRWRLSRDGSTARSRRCRRGWSRIRTRLRDASRPATALRRGGWPNHVTAVVERAAEPRERRFSQPASRGEPGARRPQHRVPTGSPEGLRRCPRFSGRGRARRQYLLPHHIR